MTSLRWAVLSTARIGINAVIPAIRESTNGEVIAIASRDGERARAVADELDIERAYASYEALLADPEVDAVYNPLPNHMHLEWSAAAARAGKHVLCEKPLAMSVAEAEELVGIADAAGVELMEAFMYRLHPRWARVRELIAHGRIGELTAVQSWFSFHNDDAANIRNVLAYGGGALMDIGCYPINLSRLLMEAEPTAVSAAITLDPASGVDVVTSGVLSFEHRTASFTCSTRIHRDQQAHIYGTEGRITVPTPFTPPPDRATQIELETADGHEVITVPAANQYTVQVEGFAEAVLDGSDLPTPPADAIANMAVIERVFAAGGVPWPPQ